LTLKKHFNKKDIPVLLDESIYYLEQDLLDRKTFIKDLELEIKNIPCEKSVVTIGLYGSWGEGKTSVMNILQNRLKENNQFLLVDYNPWNFKDEKAILAAFYQKIEQTINNKYILPGFNKTLTKYKNMISMGLSNTGLNIHLQNSNESLDEIKVKIENYIEQIGKKLIIFIDDLDRLQPKEVFLIFKIIRSSANFKNIIFFLAFDPRIIKRYLKENLELESEFLEKIIQRPIPLPHAEQDSIENFIYENIHTLFEKLKISKDRREKFYKDFNVIYQTQVKNIIKTLRRAKRYLNGLYFTLTPIKNEVNLNDFFILEIIRNVYPNVYEDIWINKWSYLPVNWDVEYFFSSPFYSNIDDDKKAGIIKKHIEDIISGEEEMKTLIELLKSLFFIVQDVLQGHKTVRGYPAERYRTEKRITHPECFRKYFLLKVPSEDISDEFIETTLKLFSENKEENRENIIFETLLNIQKQNSLSKFFDKLLIFTEKITEDVSLSLIRFLYSASDNFSREKPYGSSKSEYDKSIKLLMFITNNNIGKNKIHSILEEAVNNSGLSYAVTIIYFCQRNGRGTYFNIYDSINIDKLKEIVLERLERYFIKEKRDIIKEIDDWNRVLYQWGSNWETFEGENNIVVNDYIFSIISEDPKKFVTFLKSQKGLSFDDEIVFNVKEISRIYNIEDLNKLAEKYKDNPNLSSEERNTIEIFINTYQKYIHK